MSDQADRLREMALHVKQQIENELAAEIRPSRVIVVSSGKGGVGKSTLALNLSLSLCALGKRVILLDADMGLANIDIMLGLVPKYNIHHMIQGEKTLEDITIAGPRDLKIIPGGSGISELANLDSVDLKKIIMELGKLDALYDYLVIDTGAGISRNVITFLLAADDMIIVTTPEPTAVTDAYGTVKTIANQPGQRNIYLVINRIADANEGMQVADKFRLVCEKFLNVDIKMLGMVYNEPLVGEGIKKQQAFIDLYPRSTAARNIHMLAANLINLHTGDDIPADFASGGIRKFFRKIAGLMQQ